MDGFISTTFEASANKGVNYKYKCMRHFTLLVFKGYQSRCTVGQAYKLAHLNVVASLYVSLYSRVTDTIRDVGHDILHTLVARISHCRARVGLMI